MLRLINNRVGNQWLRDTNGLVSFARPVTLKVTQVEPPKVESHDERNMRMRRPQSPHLTIYAPQLTSMLSISHRFSGLALSGYAIGLGVGAFVLPEAIPTYIEHLQSPEVGATTVNAIKFLLAFPFSYHFWNGIRHLLWDTGKFLTIREVYLTGYIMLFMTVSSAIALTVM